MNCPYCGSDKTVKYGTKGGKQNHRCKNCSIQFGENVSQEKREAAVIARKNKGKDIQNTVNDQKQEDPIRGIVNRSEESNLRQQLAKTQRERAFQDLMLEAIKGSAPAFTTPPPMPTISFSESKTTTRLILCLADHHTNRVVDPKAIEGFNQYNFDIFARRVWSIVLGVISIARAQYTHSNRIDQLSVNFLGDIGNDSNREDNLRTNQMAENVASLCAAHVLAQAIDCLARSQDDHGNALFPSIVVRGVVGNEPRFDKKFNWSQPWRSWDWMIYQWISASLGDCGGRVSYVIPYSMMFRTEELGWRFLIDHGHQVKSWAGIPYYGVSRNNAKQQWMRRDDGGFEYRLTGHLHVEASLPTFCRKHFICPSLVGQDGFSHNGLNETTEVAQKLLAVTEKRGVISEHTVFADDEHEAPFVYDVDMAVSGAFTAMEKWRKEQL